ncbi:hypothetical protein JAO78_007445 [Alishewanella sp. 16-MA]|uniref:Uncharacterized protein n=1 Tax=Alishewanella maricola TaxID=2795740 RepID=A0ABS8C3F0_9ALTE|nr:hypothetical protein [Alishewanella maricola]MCB5226650.1 hypothetical protein [Alishewanella maricola]
MLFAEFAVNPDVVRDCRDLQLLNAHFSRYSGALISKFPDSWAESVLQRLSKVSFSEQQKAQILIPKLLQNALLSFERQYRTANWCDEAIASHKAQNFYALLGMRETRLPEFISTLDEIDHVDFRRIGSRSVECRAQELANAALPILRSAERISLIDPYAKLGNNINRGYGKTLEAMFEKIAGRSVAFDIFAEDDQTNLDQELVKFKDFKQRIPPNIQLTWFFLSDDGNGALHQRMILGNNLGLIYDRGFKHENDLDRQAVGTPVYVAKLPDIERANRRYNYVQPEQRVVLKLT